MMSPYQMATSQSSGKMSNPFDIKTRFGTKHYEYLKIILLQHINHTTSVYDVNYKTETETPIVKQPRTQHTLNPNKHIDGWDRLLDDMPGYKKVRGRNHNVRKHNIQSNAPRKKRIVYIDSLDEWNCNHEYPPLMIDDIINLLFLPDDEYKRFNLFNYSKNSIKLKHFCIKNQNGLKFNLDEREIRANGYIVIALNKVKKRTDIQVSNEFKNTFNFKANEKLFLCDSRNNEIQIFPSNQRIYPSLEIWNQSPLNVTLFTNATMYGFTVENITGNDITLINHYFTNKYGTFKKDISNTKLSTAETFKIVVIKDHNQYGNCFGKNDLFVEESAFNLNRVDDVLLICDQSNNQFELCQLNQQFQQINQNTIVNCK
eukprot:20581_1